MHITNVWVLRKRKPVKHKKKARITWRFAADSVHDFAWTADREYQHQRFTLPTGTQIHYLYLPDAKSRMMYENERFRADLATYFAFMNERFGPYRWPQFSVIQGGEGAMEYPMCTLMESHGDDYLGTFSVVAHEGSHMWFYGMLATDEQRYHWMDEGFTSFAEDEVMNVISGANKPNAHEGYLSTFAKRAAKAAWREPASTPANYFDGKFPYQMAAYMMGSLYLKMGELAAKDKKPIRIFAYGVELVKERNEETPEVLINYFTGGSTEKDPYAKSAHPMVEAFEKWGGFIGRDQYARTTWSATTSRRAVSRARTTR